MKPPFDPDCIGTQDVAKGSRIVNQGVDPPVKVFAHRGASGYAPENTLQAFSKALEMGAKGIELDVHFVNGKILVYHDEKAAESQCSFRQLWGKS